MREVVTYFGVPGVVAGIIGCLVLATDWREGKNLVGQEPLDVQWAFIAGALVAWVFGFIVFVQPS